jgi:hypothetical protein
MFESGELAEVLGVAPGEEPGMIEEQPAAKRPIGLENRLE